MINTREGDQAGVIPKANHFKLGDIIDERNGWNQTLLHLAVERGNQEVVEILLDNGATIEVIDCCGQTPLHLAVERNNQEVVKLLLDNGATFEVIDCEGLTPLHTAVRNGQENMVRLLLERGAAINNASEVILREVNLSRVPPGEFGFNDRNQRVSQPYRTCTNDLGSTMYCVVEELEHNLPDIKLSFHYSGPSLLYQAIISGHKEIVGILVEGGADVNATDFEGMTSLLMATRAGKKDMVELLLRYCADVNAKDSHGKTPLHEASFHGYKNLTKLLIGANADTRARDKQENTPLQSMINGLNKQTRKGLTKSMKEYGEVTRLLLEGGANPNEKYGYGSTILQEAIKKGYWAVVGPLLDAGASFETALDEMVFAASAMHDEVAGILPKLIPKTSTQTRRFAALKIYVAAIKGRYEEVEQLFSGDADIEKDDVLIVGALHRSAEGGDDAVVKALLNAGVNVDSESDIPNRWPTYQTALHLAVQGGHEAVVRRLVNSKASIDKINRSGALVDAAGHGHEVIVEFLLKNGADVNALRGGQNRDTALIQSAIHGYTQLMRVLLQYGADVNYYHRDCFGKQHSALSEAIDNRQVTAIEILLESGANPNSPITRLFISSNYKISFSELCLAPPITPLQWAAFGGWVEIAKLLLEKGANINSKSYQGWTALHFAAYNGHKAIVSLLLRKGALENTQTLNGKRTLLHAAVKGGNVNIVRLLLKKGFTNLSTNPTIRRLDHKFSLLHHSVQEGHHGMIRLLLRNGADVSARDKHGNTPLHIAAYVGAAVVDALLRSDEIDVNVKGRWGRTPLHYAVQEGLEDVVRVLLMYGASRGASHDNGIDVNAKDNYSYTPLHYAAEGGLEEVTELLLAHGASCGAKTVDGWTPEYIALSQGHRKLALLLVVGPPKKLSTSLLPKIGETNAESPPKIRTKRYKEPSKQRRRNNEL